MVDFDRSAFIAKFQEEAAELLQRLNEGVITLESSPDDRELIDSMLRDAHTLKGSSRMVGLIEISDVAHRLEDIMVKVRERELAYTPELSDHFFEALDAIVFLSEHRGDNEGGALDLAGLQERLCAVAGNGDGGQTDPAEAGAVLPSETSRAVSPAVCAGPGAADSELRAKDQPTIRVQTTQVDRLLNLAGEAVIGHIKTERRAEEAKRLVAESTDMVRQWEQIRRALVAAGMGNLLGEDALTEFDTALAGQRSSLSAFVKGHAEDLARNALVVHDLQDQGMRLRMLPASTVFQVFPRAIRDLAREFDKEVELVVEGGETELDKKVLEEINDPLVHIMRNAVDHGIEDPETRELAGKPRCGTIRLSARQEGDRIVVEVSDDGAGIDPDRVRTLAVRKGYLTESEATALTDRQALYLIFEAGFSTATIITEVSGRGVGMDVVHEFIVEKLKGSLDVYSKPGEGTTFRLTIPLTLAIIRALLLRVGNHTYALPTASVEETLRVDVSEIQRVEGREAVRRGRRTYPLTHLGEMLGVTERGYEGAKVSIVAIGHSGHRLGFVVDAFEGEQQIVIKTLGKHLAKVDNIAGVTVLGAGDVVPILDVPDLMTNALSRAGQRIGVGAHLQHTGPRTILICEDSFTTRELERSIFEAAGYQVVTANDGAAGLTKLREGLEPDAVVTDVQMPRMTGFELTRAIKADAMLAQIPVVIVTSLEREEEKAIGVEAGADAYITKSVFNQDTLIETVERLIR